MLALAHKIHDAIDRGTVRDRAEVARRLGFTRARITHLLDLTLLAPDLQEQILSFEAVDGAEPVSERALRRRHLDADPSSTLSDLHSARAVREKICERFIDRLAPWVDTPEIPRGWGRCVQGLEALRHGGVGPRSRDRAPLGEVMRRR